MSNNSIITLNTTFKVNTAVVTFSYISKIVYSKYVVKSAEISIYKENNTIKVISGDSHITVFEYTSMKIENSGSQLSITCKDENNMILAIDCFYKS